MQVQCSQTRNVLHIPWLTLFPGLETYGSDKKQGLLAGLEYLTDEPGFPDVDKFHHLPSDGADAQMFVPDRR